MLKRAWRYVLRSDTDSLSRSCWYRGQSPCYLCLLERLSKCRKTTRLAATVRIGVTWAVWDPMEWCAKSRGALSDQDHGPGESEQPGQAGACCRHPEPSIPQEILQLQRFVLCRRDEFDACASATSRPWQGHVPARVPAARVRSRPAQLRVQVLEGQSALKGLP